MSLSSDSCRPLANPRTAASADFGLDGAFCSFSWGFVDFGLEAKVRFFFEIGATFCLSEESIDVDLCVAGVSIQAPIVLGVLVVAGVILEILDLVVDVC